jgi:hypothetical protein
VPPPAANGTMKVIGLSGHVWAWAWPAMTTARTVSRAHRTTVGFTVFSSDYCKLASAIGGAIVFFASWFRGSPGNGRGNEPYRMQDATHDPLK